MTEAIIKVTPEEWDAQYRSGAWDYLNNVTAHYAVIGSLVRKYECGNLLDVGCGQCLLREHIGEAGYTGLDISLQAFRFVSGVAVLHRQAETLEPEFSIWDCAVFCESLYYMPDPLEVLARYFGFCKIIFISMTSNPATNQLAKEIRERFTVVEKWELFNADHYFIIMAVKP